MTRKRKDFFAEIQRLMKSPVRDFLNGEMNETPAASPKAAEVAPPPPATKPRAKRGQPPLDPRIEAEMRRQFGAGEWRGLKRKAVVARMQQWCRDNSLPVPGDSTLQKRYAAR
jgi:hypothetical protein